jgi:hypothetical protein
MKNATVLALSIMFFWLVRALLVLGFWCLVVLALLVAVFGA